MKSKRPKTQELEAELARLTALVRERRQQLERLRICPNADCQCRVVWKEHVDKGLASQVRKLRKQLDGPQPRKVAKAKPKSH